MTSFTTRSFEQQILERELDVVVDPPRLHTAVLDQPVLTLVPSSGPAPTAPGGVGTADEGTAATALDGVQALALPGEEDRPLGVSVNRMLLVWSLATLVAVAYIGIPLTMFLVPLLGGTGSALLVAGSLVLIGVLAVRLVLRLISAHKVIGRHR